MNPDVIETLCTRCGLCCDGSIFDDVELAGETEAAGLEVMGLSIDTDEQPLLLQPCTALRGKRCSIYAHRPECCRTFECRLLQETRQGTLGVDQALEVVAQTRKQAARIRELCRESGDIDEPLSLKESCIEALSQPIACDDDRADRLHSDLAKAMDTMGALIRRHFLAMNPDTAI